MPTIQGTDGDTTGVFGSLTTAQIAALQTAASAATPGTMSINDFNKLKNVTEANIEALLTNPSDAFIAGAITSGEIDLLATSSNNVMTGVIAGRYFIPLTARWIITVINGTITTGPTANAGNDASKVNVLRSAVQITAGNLNTINTNGAPANVAAADTTNLTLQHLVSTSTSFKVDITVAATPNTATTLKGKLQILGYWAAA